MQALFPVLLSVRILPFLLDFIAFILEFGHSNLFRISDFEFQISWLRLCRARLSPGSQCR